MAANAIRSASVMPGYANRATTPPSGRKPSGFRLRWDRISLGMCKWRATGTEVVIDWEITLAKRYLYANRPRQAIEMADTAIRDAERILGTQGDTYIKQARQVIAGAQGSGAATPPGP